MSDQKDKLISRAIEAREASFSPYSGFAVGAALETLDGEIIIGCNVESATYGLTMCAERTAIFKAMSDGKHRFSSITIAADTETLTPPCGACRQIIWEFCGDIPVTMCNLDGQSDTVQMSELLPGAFDGKFLD